MRTKTNEKRRVYSLRAPRKMLKTEEDGESAKKTKCEEKESRPIIEIASPPETKRAKRKGKPTKSVAKEEIFEVINSPKTPPVDLAPPPSNSPVKATPPVAAELPVKSESQSQSKNDFLIEKLTTTKETTSETTSNSNDIAKPKTHSHQTDFQVHTALEHAVKCRLEKNCTFQKCAIAKQFLLHCSTCTEKKEECTICKAMDIMVCKHAEKCETPLDKCCPIPNCDHVRHMMMEEWLKFKSSHHEIVTRAFEGLIHARKCKEKSCESVLCKNIKTVLLHTQTCKKQEACKTRRFIVQLCEYHQETCINDKCPVEFCVENRRLRQEDNIRKQKEQQILREKQEQFMYNGGQTKPISNMGMNNVFIQNGFPGLLNMQQMVAAGQGGLVLPNGSQMVYPFPYFWPGAVPEGLFQQQLHQLQQQQQQASPAPTMAGNKEVKQPEVANPFEHTKASPNLGVNNMYFTAPPWSMNATQQAANDGQGLIYPGWAPTQYGSVVNSYNQEEVMETSTVTQPPQDEAEQETRVEEGTVDWLEKSVNAGESVGTEPMECGTPPVTSTEKEVLTPTLNSTIENVKEHQLDEQPSQSICTSPTTEMYYQLWPLKAEQIDQKAQLPRLSPDELQTILARGGNSNLLSPVHDNRAQFSEAPYLLNDFQQNSQESELEDHPIAENMIRQQREDFASCLTAEQVQVEKMDEIMKEQEEWSKIDFVKQQNIQQAYDVETETADETENDSSLSEHQPTEDDPEACYFIKNGQTDDHDDDPNEKANQSRMTALERNFLTILQASQRDGGENHG